jgi:hypothetical protein
MEYEINQNRLNEVVIKFLENYFKNEEINYFHPYDYFVDEEGNHFEGLDPNKVIFYMGKYDEDDVLFYWYGVGYWTGNNPTGDIRRSSSPMLSVEVPIENLLDEMFGEKIWHSGIKTWFESKFPYKVKTVR